MTVAVGGFGLSGIPADLIEAVRDSGVQGPDGGLQQHGRRRQGPRRADRSRPGAEGDRVLRGREQAVRRAVPGRPLEVEFTPQGTLAERLRAGGAGIPAFYTKTGVGTLVAEGKPLAEFDGETYVLERAILADVALVHAHTADTDGNLIYRYTAGTSTRWSPPQAPSPSPRPRRSSTRVAGPQPHRHPGRVRPAPGPGQRPGQGHRAAHGPPACRAARSSSR